MGMGKVEEEEGDRDKGKFFISIIVKFLKYL